MLVFTARGPLEGCLATPQRTAFTGSWWVEYLPEEQRVRRAAVTAESGRVSRGGQEFYLVLSYEARSERERAGGR